jgi:hypothetical protein
MVGSTTIVLHAPHEKIIHSVKEVWHLATELGIFNFQCLCFNIFFIDLFQNSKKKTHLWLIKLMMFSLLHQ